MTDVNYEVNFNSYEREVLDSLERITALVSQNTDALSGIEWLTYKNLGVSSSAVIKPANGKIFAFTAHNKSGNPYWIQLFDLARIPNSADTAIEVHPVFASSYLILDNAYFGSSGLKFSTGITFGFSLNNSSYAAAPANSFDLHIKYS